MNENKVDFVLLWVDGNDPEWAAEKEKYSGSGNNNSSTSNRFRDWGLLKYWFRGVEKYAPWVNHIYFVTCGHYPAWLDLSNPKLTLVKHSDFIPEEILPTFNSNTIEMNLHSIEELSEQFVLFNDDMFLISETSKEDFFVDGLPCETAILGVISSKDYEDIFPHILANNSALLNKYFSKREVLKKHRNKFFSLKYGKDIIRNIALWPFVYFSSFHDLHLPSAHLKSILARLWELEPDVMLISTGSRFRSVKDVNHWLLKSWYMCEGRFMPRSSSFGRKFELGVDDGFEDYILNHKGKVVCLNDSSEDLDFENLRIAVDRVLEQILPERCNFEKEV